MSFSELMNELVSKDSPVLAEISKLTGVDSDISTLLNNDVAMPSNSMEPEKKEVQGQPTTKEVNPTATNVSTPEPDQTPQPTPEDKSGSLW